MESIQQWLGQFDAAALWQQVRAIMTATLFTLGEAKFTAWTLAYLLLLFTLVVFVSGRIKHWLRDGVLAKSGMEPGARDAFATIARYVIVVFGFVVVLQSAGIDLSALTVLAGAVGIGVGFGLQNTLDNFFSGLIILFERPIKKGDRVEVEGLEGNVDKIAMRSTVVITNDNIAVIVPNSQFISKQVVNWSYNEPVVRLHIPVGVAYGTDPELVRKVLLQVADDEPGVLDKPAPDALFHAFGDSSLNFDLRIWTHEYATRPNLIRSHLNYRIAAALANNGIEIPFPQRDLHIRSGVLAVRREEGAGDGESA